MTFMLRRVLQIVPVFLLLSAIIFFVTSLLPGDAAITVGSDAATPEQLAAIRHELGLDQNVGVRYLQWLGGLPQGDLGNSLRTGQPVSELLWTAVPVTIELAVLAIGLSLLIGIPAGVLTAVRRGTWSDHLVSTAGMVGVSMPWFWLGLLLVLVFSLWLGWLPASGFAAITADPLANLTYMVLPTLTVGAGLTGLVLRQTRASLLNVLAEDYIRTATAKGLSQRSVMVRHGLRNALLPVVTVVGLQMGALLGGAVITETVFALPGLGRSLVDGIFARDYPVIQGAVLVIVVTVLLVNLLTDVLYTFLDPKVEF